ncbi:Holliday junction resolvase RecU [Aquibacillus salsiterrae]|uniref:Holliday junction resolvase RecU n=1 Tax=Aquibacillus salsiterrae TaxID=2950439 RepID=A0A9X3WBS1_9BACI|nr:Holliday junction resolvase RecU [Aquibacillus salsiterrae]MDC3415341.1 Holliday junction resolvase RecU [Aquibacillus salsiterrae]
MNYPNGKKNGSDSLKSSQKSETTFSNRGMTLEDDINETNEYYLVKGKAVIHKKPTPIQIVKVDYPKRSAAVIKEGYFKQASTTDYNGIYREKYIDFEAKETKNKTSFPLANFHDHQINHMKSIISHGGICFVIIRFSQLEETYLFPAKNLFLFWENQMNGGRKSIPYSYIKKTSMEIPLYFQPRVDYLTIIDQLYF